MHPDVPPLLAFVALEWFELSRDGVLDDDGLRALQTHLQANPRAGSVISGTGGARKLRVGMRGRGKRGGARVLYYFAEQRQTVYLLLAYSKSVKSNLTPAEKKAIRKVVAAIEREGDQ